MYIDATDYDKKDEGVFWSSVFKEIYAKCSDGEEAVVAINGGRNVSRFLMEDGALTPLENSIYLDKTLYDVRKFRKIDAGTGSHLFYDIIPNNMGMMTMDVGVRYGNTGGTNAGADLVEGAYVGKAFPSYLYWSKIYQLDKKGYEDYTDRVYDAEEEIAALEKLFGEDKDPEGDESETVLRVARYLGEAAKDAISSRINVDWLSNKPPFNRRQVASAKKAYNLFRTVTTAEQANEVIKNLILITDVSFKEGRSKKRLKDFLILPCSDKEEERRRIDEKISEWETVIMAMEAMLPPATGKGEDKKVLSPFGNTEMEMASAEENTRIRDKFRVGRDFHTKLVKVTAHSFNRRYEEYVAEKGISAEEEFIHGSRTPNWSSIIKNGLLLNPDAPITGKAYGYGIYTARDFEKSRGYTDYCGSKWAGGTGDAGIIGVYRCAYGKPLYPDAGRNGDYADQVRKAGCNCLDVLVRYSGYRMDEIVFYEEEALTLEYLLFFSENKKSLDWLC